MLIIPQPSPDSKDFADLSMEQRNIVRSWLKAFDKHPVIKPITQWFQKVANYLEVSPATVKLKYYALKKQADWRILVDARLGIKPATTCRTANLAFQQYFKTLCEKNQRSTAVAIRDLKRRWKNKEEIPGYEDFPSWPSYPNGWSPRNLRRFQPTKTELSAMRFGVKTAAKHLPQIYSTRVGLWPAAFYQFDDVWHDNYVRIGNHVTRVLELGALDVLSGCRFAFGAKPRMPKADGNGKQNLTEKEMRLFLAGVLYNEGYNAELGTTLVVENATAAISKDLETTLYDATGGKIKTDRSGISGKQQAVLNLWGGRGGGNPRHKASLESLHNLIHNELASLTAQTGHDRNEPEMSHGMVKYQERLLKVAADIPEARRELLQHPIIDFHSQFLPLLNDLYKHAINGRTDHNLQGWHELGYILTEYTTLPDSEQWLMLENLPSDSRQLITNLAQREPEKWSRTRKLSPLEVWESNKSQLTPIPAWLVCDILGKDHAKERKVKGSYIEFRDSDISPETVTYESRIITPEGRYKELSNGDTYLVFSNPYAPEQLFICDAHYRCLGIAPRAQRVCPADTASVLAAYGQRNQRKAEILSPLRERHAPEAKEAQDLRAHNDRIIAGDTSTAEERRSAKTSKNAAARFGRNVTAPQTQPRTPAPSHEEDWSDTPNEPTTQPNTEPTEEKW